MQTPHQESRVDALILVNDPACFPSELDNFSHLRTHAGGTAVGKAAAERSPARALDHEVARNPPTMEPRNRVVRIRRFGGPDELEVVDAPLPTAGPGEVRVRVLASSVVYTDVVIRRHLYPWVRRRPP